MSEINYSVSLAYLYPESSWTMENNDYSTLVWLDETTTKPSKAKLTGAYEEALLAQETVVATEARRIGYTVLADPVFFQWQRGEKTEQDYKDACALVVELYPIP